MSIRVFFLLLTAVLGRIGLRRRTGRSQHLANADGGVGIVRQPLHVRKERPRLTFEEPHVRKERERTISNAFCLGWPNDRNNRKTSTEERAWLWHDQIGLEELAAKWRRVQIRECHRYTGYRIDRTHRRCVACLVRPRLKVHCFGGADANQNPQYLYARGPLCQRGIKAVATLFNGRKMKPRGISDRL